MSVDSDKLREMVSDAETNSENLTDQISQIESSRDDITDQISAIENGMCGANETDMTSYLTNVKLPAFQVTYPTAVLSFGGTYGNIDYSTGNITDWEIYYMTAPVLPAIPVKVVLYEYNGIGWDSDSDIITLVDHFEFGNDYLTRPLTSGATYGLNPYKSNLNSAIDILTENKDKIDQSIAYLEPYAT